MGSLIEKQTNFLKSVVLFSYRTGLLGFFFFNYLAHPLFNNVIYLLPQKKKYREIKKDFNIHIFLNHIWFGECNLLNAY